MPRARYKKQPIIKRKPRPKFRYLFSVGKKYVPNHPLDWYKPPSDWWRYKRYEFDDLPRHYKKNWSYSRQYADYYILSFNRWLRPRFFFGLFKRQKKNLMYRIAIESVPHRRGIYGVGWLWEFLGLCAIFATIVFSYYFSIWSYHHIMRGLAHLYHVFIYSTGIEASVLRKAKYFEYDILEAEMYYIIDKTPFVEEALSGLWKKIYNFDYAQKLQQIRDYSPETHSWDDITSSLTTSMKNIFANLKEAWQIIKNG